LGSILPNPRIAIPAPADLRDLVWAPAQLVWTNGGEASGHIPVRYPGSESSTDGAVRLARKTEWQELPDETFIGVGQRVFATDEGEHPLLPCRVIDFQAAESTLLPSGRSAETPSKL